MKTSFRNRLAGIVAGSCLLLPLPAMAAVVYDTGFEIITNSEPNLEDQFRLIIEQDNLDLSFTLYNDFGYAGTPGETNSVISRLWLGSNFSDFFSLDPFTITHSETGNNWSAVIDPDKGPLKNMPGLNGHLGSDGYYLEFGAQANHRINDGIWQGESLTIGFTLDSLDWDLTGMLSAFEAGDLFVGIHVQAQEPNGTSNAYITDVGIVIPPDGGDPPGDPTPIPVPPALGIGLMGFALVGMTQLRKRFGAAARQ
jgi:hypothetical protein